MSRDEMPHTDHDLADLVRACTRKKQYPTQMVARLAINSIRERNPRADVRPYACRGCGNWHVGAVPLEERGLDGPSPGADADRIRARLGIDKSCRRTRPDGGRRRRRQPRRREEDFE